MYLSYYNLKEKPFQINTDPKFLWLGEKYKEALATLKYGVMGNRGFLLLTGNVGTGKTTIINALANNLGEKIIVAKITDPGMEKLDFFNFLGNAFNLNEKFDSKGSFLISFRRFLYNAYEQKKKVLLIIDEAQRLDNELLEEIRLLSNIEKQNIKLLNIFFVGQNEFKNILLDSRNRALRQRITINYDILPLTEKETGEYIRHRLKIAGSTKKIFNANAISEVASFSDGFPRLINIICDHALLTGYVREIKILKADIIKECAEELEISKQISNKDSKLDKPDKHKTRNSESDMRSSHSSDISETTNGTITEANVKKTGRWFSSIDVSIIMLVVFAVLAWFFYYTGTFDTPIKRIKNYLGLVLSDSSSIKSDEGYGEFGTVTKLNPDVLKDEKDSAITAIDYPRRKYEDRNYKKEVRIKKNKSIDSKPVTGREISEKEIDTISKKYVIPTGKIMINFPHNSNEFSSEEFAILNRVAEIIVQNKDIKVVITGYTDSLGTESYNKHLSKFRANMIKGYLVGKGVVYAQVETIGKGWEDPVGDNNTHEGRKENRRVEIEFLSKGSNFNKNSQ